MSTIALFLILRSIDINTSYVYVPNALFKHIGDRFSPGHESFLALSAAGHAGGARAH